MTGGGDVNLALSGPDSAAISMSSREGTNKPQLVVPPGGAERASHVLDARVVAAASLARLPPCASAIFSVPQGASVGLRPHRQRQPGRAQPLPVSARGYPWPLRDIHGPTALMRRPRTTAVTRIPRSRIQRPWRRWTWRPSTIRPSRYSRAAKVRRYGSKRISASWWSSH